MNETFLMMDLVLTNTTTGSTPAPGVYPFNLTVPAIGTFTESMSVAKFLWNITFIFFVFKQVVSIVQMFTAAQRILTHDKNTLPSQQQGSSTSSSSKATTTATTEATPASAKEESSTPAKKTRGGSVSRRR